MLQRNSFFTSWHTRCLFLFLLLLTYNSHAQYSYWLMGDKIVNTGTPALPTPNIYLPSTFSTGTGNSYQQSDYLSNSSGNPIFSIVNNQVFDASGILAFALPLWRELGEIYDLNSGELQIVQKPSNPNSYYVIYTLGSIYNTGIFYVEIDVDGAGGLTLSKTSTFGSNTIPSVIMFYEDALPWVVAITTSAPIDANGDRYLFAAGGVYATDGRTGVSRMPITASGIPSYLVPPYPVIQPFEATGPFDQNQFQCERLRLSPDQHFLSWKNVDNNYNIWILPLLNYNTYEYYGFTSTNAEEIAITSTSSNSGGVEFSPDGSKLYYSAANGLNSANIITSSTTFLGSPVAITPTTSLATAYKNTDLRIGGNNQMYAVNANGTLSCFNIASGNTETTTTITATTAPATYSHQFNRIPNPVILNNNAAAITVNVDINSRCYDPLLSLMY